MIVEVDQSNKVEYTSKDTFLGFSNGISGTLRIRAREKRELQQAFREVNKPQLFTYHTFSVLVFLLLEEHLHRITTVIIDREYPGHEDLIKSLLLQEIRRDYPRFRKQAIVFDEIGKKSGAHLAAQGARVGKRKIDRTVRSQDIMKILLTKKPGIA